MRVFATALGLILLSHPAKGFFVPFTTDQRIAASNVVAVVEVTKVDDTKGVSEAIVIHAVLGSKAEEKIEIWDDWQIDQHGQESRITSRDPSLEPGKRYFVYLSKNKRGRLVTVQSSMDCLEIVGENVEKEGQVGFEPLGDKLTKIRALIANRKDAERAAPSDGEKPPK